MTKQLKAAMTVDQHVALLRSRGMIIDEHLARQWLSNVSYYRLSAYWYPARENVTDPGQPEHFREGTTFADAVSLYEADRKLRTLVHDGMERIEVALRAHLGEQLYIGGPLAYTDPGRFRTTFDHDGWLAVAHKRIQRAMKHNESIRHYRDEYQGYPFWVLAEVLDFADISRLFEGMRAKDQHEVSERLGIHIDLTALSKAQRQKAKQEPPLVRWMEQLTIVRNTCAHHARLWNKSFNPAPTAALRTQPDLALLPQGQSERLFGALTVMGSLLRTTSPGSTWTNKVAHLLNTSFLANPLAGAASLGAPGDWDGRI